MAETRAQTMIEVNKQLDELRMNQIKQGETSDALRSELNDRFADLKNMIAELRPRYFDPQKQPMTQTPSSSATLAAVHNSPILPDPPDSQRFDQSSPYLTTKEHEKPPSQKNGLLTRLSKVGFPSSDGLNLRNWIFKCEQFFTLDGTPDESKVRLATIYMSGKALQWHQNYIAERFGVYPTWTEYVVAISVRFGGLFIDPLSELVSLKKGGDTVELFLDKFECALTRLYLPAAHSLSIFLTSLNPHLSLHTRQFHVSTVAEAANIAKMHESCLLCLPQKQYRAPFSPSPKQNTYPQYKNQNTNPPLLPFSDTTKQNHHLKPNFILKTPTEKLPRKFGFQEMQERKAKGLCMYCDVIKLNTEDPIYISWKVKTRMISMMVMN
ncbi:hypothetical protein V5N11_005994 [Cardamine amara subsp. amara]|uniref:Retrotransposon gag domain-containing protein n=1 Tax=Cardamine amara subsp. amara TaxID=228776 RepID=A0ABD1BT52_CARAN